MEREQVVYVAKLVAYSLIIAGIIMLFSAIIYLLTAPENLVIIVWVIVGALILSIGAIGIKYIRKLKLTDPRY